MTSGDGPVRLTTIEDGRESATGTGASDSPAGWTPDVEQRLARLEPAVAALLANGPTLPVDAERVVVVPDTHYPFHPSTGMVTDPAVVAAVTAVLRRDRPGVELAVAGASDEYLPFDRTTEYLGYPDALERAGVDADLVDLAEDRRVLEPVAVGDRSTELRVPQRLADDAVVVVPTLRPTESGHVAGGMRTLARLVGDGASGVGAAATEEPTTIVGAVQAVEPAFSVLDAATAYGGRTRASDVLLSGPPAAVDALGASLLERDLAEDRALSAAFEGRELSIDVEPVGDPPTLETLRERTPDGELPPSDETHPAVSVAYRLYAAVGGDAVPPQLEARR
ncbi:DUF362 domain-containing protein [Halobiforma nitratireducens]|uniref:DUF362 domain-containing protein n=1 Tax=Halobiforma nitratireducens JCM 10879 TaxID=1227454 RepID=M0LP39_9EURY|nr:DUF362 domain-containing protein [Halobiforma nitratireducens]EMA35266.1 hypothetical protein C446_13074 [Halobiforma nitratireducens JCM 10879]